MSMTMDHLPDKIPTEGVIALLIAALSATPLWRYLTKRREVDAAQERDATEHSQEIALRKLTASEKQDHKLVTTLERQVKALEGRVDELTRALYALGDERTQDKVVIAKQAAQLAAKDEQLAAKDAAYELLSSTAESYRRAAEAAQFALIEAGRHAAAQQVGEEISETDDARRSTP